jgi:hypothetical protein
MQNFCGTGVGGSAQSTDKSGQAQPQQGAHPGHSSAPSTTRAPTPPQALLAQQSQAYASQAHPQPQHSQPYHAASPQTHVGSSSGYTQPAQWIAAGYPAQTQPAVLLPAGQAVQAMQMAAVGISSAHMIPTSAMSLPQQAMPGLPVVGLSGAPASSALGQIRMQHWQQQQQGAQQTSGSQQGRQQAAAMGTLPLPQQSIGQQRASQQVVQQQSAGQQYGLQQGTAAAESSAAPPASTASASAPATAVRPGAGTLPHQDSCYCAT